MVEEHPTPTNHNFKNITGLKFGRLTVISFAGSNKNGRGMWNCSCECGKQTVARTKCLISGNKRSCGCLLKDSITFHGMSESREYRVWHDMKARCQNKNNAKYDYYGGRGISVCERWQEFQGFYEDMGPRPSKLHTLERLDNNLGYCSKNCCWTTRKNQQRNRRGNRLITHNGVTKTIAEWSEITGIPHYVIRSRVLSIKKNLHPFDPYSKRRSPSTSAR